MKKQLLDPLGTMCKLIKLNFTEINTKISIHSHVLTLNEPDDLQFFVRWYNKDGRENISELYYVIIRIIKRYLIANDEPKYIPNIGHAHLSDDNNIKEIFEKKTEEDDVDNVQIEYDDDLNLSDDDDDDFDLLDDDNDDLDLSINENKNYDINNDAEQMSNSEEITKSQVLRKMVKYLCKALVKLQETYKFGNVILALQYFINLLEDALEGKFAESKLPSYVQKKEKEYEILLDYNKMKEIWKLKTLTTICELYDNCFRVIADTDIPKKTKEALIEGYLTSIDATLEITDEDFRTLVSNSNKG